MYTRRRPRFPGCNNVYNGMICRKKTNFIVEVWKGFRFVRTTFGGLSSSCQEQQRWTSPSEINYEVSMMMVLAGKSKSSSKSIREHTYAARKHDNTSAFGEHYATWHSPQHHHPQHHIQDPQTNKWHTTTTHRGSLRHPNKIPTTKPTRRTPWNGFPHLTLTTYSTDNTPLTIHSTDNTLNWQHTPLTTHSADKTLYRQHALLLTALSPGLANSTPSRTRQQQLHPCHNLQSPQSYVHSYPRSTGFLSL